LVLVDEADRLKAPMLEQLRARYDRRGFALVLIGMPGLEKRLARYAPFYSRVGFVQQFRALSLEEMYVSLARHWQRIGLTLTADDFSDAEALAAITRITGGNFRLVQRLFTQVDRILQINELRDHKGGYRGRTGAARHWPTLSLIPPCIAAYSLPFTAEDDVHARVDFPVRQLYDGARCDVNRRVRAHGGPPPV
jgi:hypothetical protein